MADDTIAITGHRIYPDRASLLRGLNTLDGRHYYFGGARGVDSDALEHIARTQPRSIRTVVVPNRLIDQPASARAAIDRFSTHVIELKNTGPDRYMLRNKFMVDNSDRVAAFYDFRGRGGTFNTIEYARDTGKPFITFPMREYNVDEFSNMSSEEFGSWLKRMKRYNLNLSSVKGMILRIIREIFSMSVGDFFDSLNLFNCNSLEDFWLR